METEPDEEAISAAPEKTTTAPVAESSTEPSGDTNAASSSDESSSSGSSTSDSSQDDSDKTSEKNISPSSIKSEPAESMAVDESAVKECANPIDIKPSTEVLEPKAGCAKLASTVAPDTKFDPPVEMLVDDEEEPAEQPKEATMSPFCSRSLSPSPTVSPEVLVQGNENSESSSGSEEILPDQALPMEKVDVGVDFNDDEKPKPSVLHHMDADPLELDEPIVVERRVTTRLRRTVVRQPTNSEDDFFSDEDDEEEEEEVEEMRKTIMIGGSYQAVVPEGLCKYGDAKPYKNPDKLLWDPKNLSDSSIEKYLVSIREVTENGSQGIHSLPMGAHTRDDEQALHLLLQCNQNVDEALKKWTANPPAPPSASQLWTDEECRNFENGLLMFGKDFHSIQAQKVRTRSVAELVQFYYLWKKTERHDVFANKMRPDKKKYMLHPGITLLVFEMLEKENNKEAVAKDAHVTA